VEPRQGDLESAEDETLDDDCCDEVVAAGNCFIVTDKTTKALIGLLYLAGALRSNKQSLEELWGTDRDGIEKFRLMMNQRRFKFLIRCI
jgi:hypothetical protein